MIKVIVDLRSEWITALLLRHVPLEAPGFSVIAWMSNHLKNGGDPDYYPQPLRLIYFVLLLFVLKKSWSLNTSLSTPDSGIG